MGQEIETSYYIQQIYIVLAFTGTIYYRTVVRKLKVLKAILNYNNYIQVNYQKWKD